MKTFFKSSKEYKRNPAAFLGTPQLPGYKKKGGTMHCRSLGSKSGTVKHDRADKKFKLPLTDKSRL